LGSTGKSEICFSNGFVLLLDLAKCKEYCGTEENEETEGYPQPSQLFIVVVKVGRSG
jgi:hypothetical protein